MSDMEFNKKVKEVENDERLLLFLREENENKFDISRILPRFPAPYNGRMSEWFFENMTYILASDNEYCKQVMEQYNNYKEKTSTKKIEEEKAKADETKKRKDWLMEREGKLSWKIGQVKKPSPPKKSKKTKRYSFDRFDNYDDYESYDVYDEFAEDVDSFSSKVNEHETLDEYLSKYKITEEEFKEAVSSLSEIEQEYIKLYFGFDSEFMSMTIDQIAEFKEQQRSEVKKIINKVKKKIPAIVKNLRTLHKIEKEKEENPDKFYYVEPKKERPKKVEHPKVQEVKKEKTPTKRKSGRPSNSPADTMTIDTLIRDTNMTYEEIIKAIEFLPPLRKECTMMKCGLTGNKPMTIEEIAAFKNITNASVRGLLVKVPTDLVAIKNGGYRPLIEIAYESMRQQKISSYKDSLIEKIGKSEEEITKVIPFLPKSQKTCFEARFVDNKSVVEIAKENNLSVGGVNSNINLAVKNIIKYIDEGYDNIKREKPKKKVKKRIQITSPADTMTIETLINDTGMNYSEIVMAINFLAPVRKELTMMKCGLDKYETMSIDEIVKAKNIPKSSVRKSLLNVPTDLVTIKEAGYKSLMSIANENKNKEKSYKSKIIEKIGKSEEEIIKLIPQLPKSQRTCFESRFINNKSVEDIAKENNLSVSGVGSNINLAVKNIISYINNDYEKPKNSVRKMPNKYKKYLSQFGHTKEEVEKALPFLPKEQEKYFKSVIIENKMNKEFAKEENVSIAHVSRIVKLAKVNIDRIINLNYEVVNLDLEYSSKQNIKKDLYLKELGISEEELLIYISLLPERPKDCLKHVLNVGNDILTKEEIMTKYKIDNIAISSASSYAKRKINSMMLDPGTIDYVETNASLEAFLTIRYQGKTKEEFIYALNILIEEEKEFMMLFLGIDTKRHTSKEIAKQKLMREYKVKKVLYAAMDDLDSILIYNKMPVRKEINRHDSPLYKIEILEKEIGKTYKEIVMAIPNIPEEQANYFISYYENNNSLSAISKTNNISVSKLKRILEKAKENIKLVIDSNYELVVEEYDFPTELMNKYNLSFDDLLKLVDEFKTDYRKDCACYVLKTDDSLNKEEIIKKHKKDEHSFYSSCSLTRKRIIELIENGKKQRKKKLMLDTLDEVCNKINISTNDFILILRSFEGNRRIYTSHYYDIDLEKLSIEEIANKYDTTERKVTHNIISAIKTVREINYSDKVYDAKLKGLKNKLKLIYENMEKVEDFKKKANLVSYPGMVAISLINNFNFKIEQVRIALGYNTKQEVINLLVSVCEVLIQEEDSNDLKPNDNYKDDVNVKDSVYKLEGKN